MKTTTPVPRIGRILDLVGAALFLAGAIVYARSWFGLRAMDAFDPAASGRSAIEHADALARLGRVGFALMAAGVVVGVLAAIVAKRRTRAA